MARTSTIDKTLYTRDFLLVWDWENSLENLQDSGKFETLMRKDSLLLETGKIKVNGRDKHNGRTPLSWTARGGYEAVVKLLLETGKVSVDGRDDHGRTPLSWAVTGWHEAMVKLLLETGKVDIDGRDKHRRTPLS